MTSIEAHGEDICALVMFDDGTRFVTAGTDGKIKLWGASNCDLVGQRELETGIYAVAVTSDSERVYFGGQDGKIYLWRMSDPTLPAICVIEALLGAPCGVFELSLIDAGDRAISLGDNDAIRVWDFNAHHEIVKLTAKLVSQWTSVCVTTDCSRAVTGSACTINGGILCVWDLDSYTLVGVLVGHSDKINDVTTFPHTPFIIASASNDRSVRLWNINTLTQEKIIEYKHWCIHTCASSDGFRLLTTEMPHQHQPEAAATGGGKKGTSIAGVIHVLDTSSFEEVQVVECEVTITVLAMSPKSNVIAVGARGGKVLFYSVGVGTAPLLK